MWDCERALRGLASDIEPTAAQKEAASRSQTYLRSHLESGQFGNRILDAYLSGSYARDTALAPIDDVDIVIVVDPRWLGSSHLELAAGTQTHPRKLRASNSLPVSR